MLVCQRQEAREREREGDEQQAYILAHTVCKYNYVHTDFQCIPIINLSISHHLSARFDKGSNEFGLVGIRALVRVRSAV